MKITTTTPDEPRAVAGARTTKPVVSIGWVLATDLQDEALLRALSRTRQRLLDILSGQFPQFDWQLPALARHRYPPRGAIDALPLLELGLHEKINSRLDYVLVIVSNELIPRDRILTIGVPSSALEVAVLSTARLATDEQFGERLAGLALHLLGHMWGLEHAESGPMIPPEEWTTLRAETFPESQEAKVVERLEEVADARLEEQPSRRGWLLFHWHTFWADPKGILVDVVGYAPWKTPFRMGRLTAAAATSVLFLLLGAEAWEIGVNTSTGALISGALVAIISATLFIFLGQNLNQVSRQVGLREQLIRTRLVLLFTLLLGMATLWGVLFLVSYLAVLYVPRQVPMAWLNITLDLTLLARHAAFMATLGVLAAALGGNLEDEQVLKARLYYDEET